MKQASKDQSDQIKDISAKATQALADNRNAIDKAFKENEAALKANTTQGKAALDASADALFRELRAYVTTRDLQVIGDVATGSKFSGLASITNAGRTPAVDMKVCGDILLTPWSKPIDDTYPCPGPRDVDQPPRPESDGENSTFVLGSNGPVLEVRSPGNTFIRPDRLRERLSSHEYRLYFYGFVHYRDIVRKASHSTAFCGMYNANTNVWTLCEKHNGIG